MRARRTRDVFEIYRKDFKIYTKDFKAEDFRRVFTHETHDAYKFFARDIDPKTFEGQPWHVQLRARIRLVFMAFSIKLSPARRVLYGISLLAALIGLLQLFERFGLIRVPLLPFLRIPVPGPLWADGTFWLTFGFVLVNLLLLLEVADRLSLKGDLEVARDIQLTMLPQGTFATGDIEVAGRTRPANTVGGDFYDILPLSDDRVVVALGDVAGKGSPAALVMALLLAMLRTLADENLEPAELVTRLNTQVVRQIPVSRFITLVLGVYTRSTGEFAYVNAGHPPPLLRRGSGRCDRLVTGGVALGLFDGSCYQADRIVIDPGDVMVLYSDGITEAENEQGDPVDESGLEQVIARDAHRSAVDLGAAIFKSVERHAGNTKLADDLTVLVLRRLHPST